MANHSSLTASFTRHRLPMVVSGVALLAYIIGLQPWLTATNLSNASKVLGWDFWSQHLQGSLYFLVTFPVRWLPLAWQVPALNLFSALCAAATLGLLVRAVTLLPQDRTTYQRMRNRAENGGLMESHFAWVPPVAAAALLALQLTFWEHAIAGSQESFNALLFAMVLVILLEYRLNKSDAWLRAFAFAYGLALSNNWAMLSFAPVAAVAMTWIAGARLLRVKFLASLAACGFAGLLPFLVLPMVQASQDWHGFGFWDTLKWALASQRMAFFREKGWLLCPLPAIAGLIWMGVRWSTHSGEVSRLSLRLSAVMHQFIPIVLLAGNVLFMFDLPASPRQLMPQHSFLPLHFLGAMVAGYCVGYFLLIGSGAGDSGRRRPGGFGVWTERMNKGLGWGALALPLVLLWQGMPGIARAKQSPLRDVSMRLTSTLPDKSSIVLADNPVYLLLAQADYARRGLAFPHAAVSTRSLESPSYHKLLESRYPALWKNLFPDAEWKDGIPSLALLGAMVQQAGQHEIHYLHPSFGYYFEVFHFEPMGLTGKLVKYSPDSVNAPPLSPEAIAANQGFWEHVPPPHWRQPAAESKRPADALIAGQILSRAANEWGVHQQRAGRLLDARPMFETALTYYPSNKAAHINIGVNTELQARRSTVIASVQNAAEAFGEGRGWQEALNDFGSYDEPRLCYSLGTTFSATGLSRQAAILFGRARELDPTNAVYHLAEAEMLLKGNMPDRTLAAVKSLKQSGLLAGLSTTNQVLAARVEALAYLSKTNVTQAAAALRNVEGKIGRIPILLDVIVEIMSASGNHAEALKALDEWMAQAPAPEQKILHKAFLQTQLRQHEKAMETASLVLNKNPRSTGALELRAMNALELKRFPEARADYEELDRLQPAGAASQLGLGELHLRRGDLGLAKGFFETVLKRVPAGSREASLARQRLDEIRRRTP